jgi:hypothetical protein
MGKGLGAERIEERVDDMRAMARYGVIERIGQSDVFGGGLDWEFDGSTF